MPVRDWTTIAADDYDDFRTGSNISEMLDVPATPTSTRSSGSMGTTSRSNFTRDPVADFCRGIKRDVSHYSVLKDEKQWDAWSRSTVAQARAQDVDDVINPAYTPTNNAEKTLFKEKQKFMFAVFERTLLTDQGKAYVRQYTKTFDAQSIY